MNIFAALTHVPANRMGKARSAARSGCRLVACASLAAAAFAVAAPEAQAAAAVNVTVITNLNTEQTLGYAMGIESASGTLYFCGQLVGSSTTYAVSGLPSTFYVIVYDDSVDSDCNQGDGMAGYSKEFSGVKSGQSVTANFS